MARPKPGSWICARRGHVMPAGPVMLRTATPDDLPELRRTVDADTLAALGWTDQWELAWAADGAVAAPSTAGPLRRRLGLGAPAPVSEAMLRNPVSERFLILDGAARAVLGGIDMARAGAPRTVRVSFWLAPAARGHGHTVHALGGLGRLAAGHLGVETIVATSSASNPAAQAVLRGAGFLDDGGRDPDGSWRMVCGSTRRAARSCAHASTRCAPCSARGSTGPRAARPERRRGSVAGNRRRPVARRALGPPGLSGVVVQSPGTAAGPTRTRRGRRRSAR